MAHVDVRAVCHVARNAVGSSIDPVLKLILLLRQRLSPKEHSREPSKHFRERFEVATGVLSKSRKTLTLDTGRDRRLVAARRTR